MGELSAAHRLMLEVDSAIEPALIELRGYRTMTDAGEVMSLGFSKDQARVPGLLVPIWAPHGTGPVGYQYRPDEPRMKGGKPIKYESMPKAVNRLDVPPAVRPMLGDPSIDLWITEGSKKADAAASKGLACIALTGVWNFKQTNEHGGSVVLGDFEHIPVKGRTVVICYDSDVSEKSQVRQARERLRDLLLSRGAIVRYCSLPGGDGQKVGLDDYFAAGGTVEELKRCVHEGPIPVLAVTLADVEAQRVDWLWKPYLPLGELTLLAGDGGVGKSYLAMTFSKAVTLGEALPGGERRPPSDVLFVTDEDDISRTVKPRAELLGLDQTRFHVIDLATLDGSSWLEAVRENARRWNVSLVVLDPLQSFLGSGLDLNKTSDVRPLIRKLRELAQDTGATILVVTHVNKMTGGRAHYRVNGSVDIVNGVRSALMAGRVEVEGEEIQVLGHAKSNYAARGPSLRYEIDGNGFTWRGTVTVGVEDISTGRKAVTKIDEAADFLKGALAHGAKPQRELESAGLEQGHSKATLQRAKRVLGLRSAKRAHGWEWVLPEQDAQDVIDGDVEHLNPAQVRSAATNEVGKPDLEHLECEPLLLGIKKVQTEHGAGLIL